jgi:hypothetical protein
MIPQGLVLSLPFSFLVLPEPFLGYFCLVDLWPIPYDFGWRCIHEPSMVLLFVVPLSNP